MTNFYLAEPGGPQGSRQPACVWGPETQSTRGPHSTGAWGPLFPTFPIREPVSPTKPVPWMPGGPGSPTPHPPYCALHRAAVSMGTVAFSHVGGIMETLMCPDRV